MPPFLLLLVPYLRPLLPWLAGAALLGAAAGYLYHRGDLAARREADRAALVHEIEQRRTRDAVDRSVAAVPDPAAELRRSWSRP